MENLPILISLLFVLLTFLTIWLFYKGTNKSNKILIAIMAWLVLQGIIGYASFYLVTNTLPPRFVLLIAPPVLLIVCLFISRKGRRFIDTLNTKYLALLHIVRLPVELILYGLLVYKLIPGLMTFEGNNLDILSGISAPLIVYFGYFKNKLNKNVILVWNFICLALLFNIVITAIFCAPFPFQKFAFDQPNIGVLYFPFIWLPCFIVPVVLFSHLVCIRQLLFNKSL